MGYSLPRLLNSATPTLKGLWQSGTQCQSQPGVCLHSAEWIPKGIELHWGCFEAGYEKSEGVVQATVGIFQGEGQRQVPGGNRECEEIWMVREEWIV